VRRRQGARGWRRSRRWRGQSARARTRSRNGRSGQASRRGPPPRGCRTTVRACPAPARGQAPARPRQGARRTLGACTVDGHGVGDDVLQHHADHDEKLSGDVERILAGESDPAASRTSKRDKPRSDEASTDIDVGTALRTEDRHGIHELAEDHFDGPGQREPHADGGELRRGQRQRLLDPESLVTSPSAP
jgi:hypothetical protein